MNGVRSKYETEGWEGPPRLTTRQHQHQKSDLKQRKKTVNDTSQRFVHPIRFSNLGGFENRICLHETGTP
ncbi:hypothetical protein Mapa_011805 [Marchantia paleacea]|nr:hypothetical protein Mapa_011805 [Marchantia paleacea]